jgi:hypothetical protein
VTDELVAFLRARLDEDAEAAAEASATERHYPWALSLAEDHYGDNVIGVEPVRLLAEVAAKRAIVDEYEEAVAAARGYREIDWPDHLQERGKVERAAADDRVAALYAALHHLVQPYVGHPDFDPAWTVEVPA